MVDLQRFVDIQRHPKSSRASLLLLLWHSGLCRLPYKSHVTQKKQMRFRREIWARARSPRLASQPPRGSEAAREQAFNWISCYIMKRFTKLVGFLLRWDEVTMKEGKSVAGYSCCSVRLVPFGQCTCNVSRTWVIDTEKLFFFFFFKQRLTVKIYNVVVV